MALPGRHFHVPAREMLLPARQVCPVYPALGLEGVAVTPAGQHHLVLTLLPSVRSYLGPDLVRVQRQTALLVAGLVAGSLRARPDVARAAGEWVLLAWEAMLDELVDAFAGEALRADRLPPW